MKHRPFINALVKEMARILYQHSKDQSPDSIYSDNQIVDMMEELIAEIEKHKSHYTVPRCAKCNNFEKFCSCVGDPLDE